MNYTKLKTHYVWEKCKSCTQMQYLSGIIKYIFSGPMRGKFCINTIVQERIGFKYSLILGNL